jgi:hypothetical protein
MREQIRSAYNLAALGWLSACAGAIYIAVDRVDSSQWIWAAISGVTVAIALYLCVSCWRKSRA